MTTVFDIVILRRGGGSKGCTGTTLTLLLTCISSSGSSSTLSSWDILGRIRGGGGRAVEGLGVGEEAAMVVDAFVGVVGEGISGCAVAGRILSGVALGAGLVMTDVLLTKSEENSSSA